MRSLFEVSLGLAGGGEHRSAATVSEQRSGAGHGEPSREAKRSGSASSFTIQSQVVTSDQPEAGSEAVFKRRFKVSSARCGCFWCEKCCGSKGHYIRQRLKRAIGKWKRALMVTLTVDPELFDNDPAKAWRYLRENRCVSRWVREMKRKGFLYSGDYFCITEIQEEKTLFPHFHILLHSRFVPHADALAVWDRFRPDWAGPVEGDRPAMGTVWFSTGRDKRVFRGMEHAAMYVSKYLVKPLKQGVPKWVAEFKPGRVVRYSISKGFWRQNGGEANETAADDPEADPTDETIAENVTDREFRTVSERMARCGDTSVLIAEDVDQDGNVGRRQFMAALPYSWAGMKSWLDDGEAKASIMVPRSIADDLMQRAKHDRWSDIWMYANEFSGMELCQGTRNPNVVRVGWS